MCQLLGMNCNTPTDIVFSFTGFATRGGLTDHHSDGWGIAFFEGLGLRHFVDPQPACDSPVADLIRRYPIRSRNVIAHIRKATQGAVALENCPDDKRRKVDFPEALRRHLIAHGYPAPNEAVRSAVPSSARP